VVEMLKTDNEASREFRIAMTISASTRVYTDANEAVLSPIASKLFGFPWTDSVEVGPNFVKVKKQDWVEWSMLEQPLVGLIEEHFTDKKDAANIEENPQPKAPETKNLNSPEAQQIQQLIEEQINPALADHGGYVVLHEVKGSDVYLEMGGGCQGCAMSYQTLKEGIEGAIKSTVPTIQQVIDVTRHEEGANPYY
jgi:Fe-S cluster biogenesis protein NfuA